MNSKTMFYIIKRLLLALVTVVVVITVTFLVAFIGSKNGFGCDDGFGCRY